MKYSPAAEEAFMGEPVLSLQQMLSELSNHYRFLPRLIPNGRYDEETLEAVMLFQREFFPPVTGVVDYHTWAAIYDKWERMNQENPESRIFRPFPFNEFIVEKGERNVRNMLPQTMFQALATVISGIEGHEVEGEHVEQSVRNVKWLQKRSNLPVTGVINAATWDALSRLYEIIISREDSDNKQEYG